MLKGAVTIRVPLSPPMSTVTLACGTITMILRLIVMPAWVLVIGTWAGRWPQLHVVETIQENIRGRGLVPLDVRVIPLMTLAVMRVRTAFGMAFVTLPAPTSATGTKFFTATLVLGRRGITEETRMKTVGGKDVTTVNG